MNTPEFLQKISDLDIKLSIRSSKLHCSAPEGILTEEIRTEITTRRDEIIRLLGSDHHSPVESLNAISMRPRNGAYPLSSGQQRLWFLHKLEPDNTAYHLMAIQRIKAELNLDILKASLSRLATRQEILRVAIEESDGVPFQKVVEMELPLNILDFADVPDNLIEEKVRALTQTEMQKPFGNSLLWRMTLVRVRPEFWYVVLTIHHLIADGWSLGVFYKELSLIYDAELQGKSAVLPELHLQYLDFAQWQQKSLQSEESKQHAAYWKAKLASANPLLDLPIDKPRGRIQSSKGGVETFVLSPQTCSGLKLLSRQCQATLFMILLAAFKVLLFRYTRQSDIVVGTPMANRSLPEYESLIGFFANTLALRTDLSGNPSVRELIHRVRETVLEAGEHQELPFEKVVEAVHPERTLSYSPVFQAAIALQNTPNTAAYEMVSGGAIFDLCAYFWDGGREITGSIEYNADLFAAATITRLIRNFQVLLDSFIHNPEQKISHLDLIAPEESRKLLHSWNSTGSAYPFDSCIHELIEIQAEKSPQAEAVRFNENALTYAELMSRSNQLARALRKRGIGPDKLVGICMNRSLEMAVALQGVLKAGGAYVPLDPSYPMERIAFMMEDAGLALLLTEEGLIPKLPDKLPPALCIDRNWPLIASEPSHKLDRLANPQNLAYVIYTSGSTGKPKGVQIEHRAVANLLLSMQREPGITANDCLLAVATLSFDIAGLEHYLPLIAGARIVIASRDTAMDGIRLAELLRRSGATVMQATPATWRLLIDSGWREGLGLKAICGGEALPPKLADELLAANVELWNQYGPTETTIYSTIYRVRGGEDPVPIGRPIANTTIYILDPNGQPVPTNVPGELHIGGDGVARGYLNRPDLTSSRFIPDTFTAKPGSRLYKTGDLARYRANGTIEYLGRIDHQVKVRGYRIELGEIESVLTEHRSVKEAVVIVREDVPGDRRIIGYVIPNGSTTADPAALRAHLSAKLPEYMIPSAFVFAKKFPLTPNGKVDRLALPAPDRSGDAMVRYVPPKTDTEVALAAIWHDILHVDRVGLHDNFFDLGGYSLLVVQLQNRVQKQFSQRLLLAQVFQNPTVGAMAKLLDEAPGAASGKVGRICDNKSGMADTPDLVAVQPNGTRAPLFAIPGIGGNMLGYGELAPLLGDDQPFFGLQSQGLDGSKPPLKSVEEISIRFIQQIRSIRPHGPYYFVGQCMGGVIAFEIAQQLVAAGEEVPLLFMIETWPPATAIKRKQVSAYASHLSFLIEGVSRHIYRMVELGPRQSISYLCEKIGILQEMVQQRDIYRGDRSPLYQKLVESANYRAFSQYSPKQYPGKIVMLLASEREVNSAADPRFTWAQLADRGCEILFLSGNDSGSLLRKPSVYQLATLITERLFLRMGPSPNLSSTLSIR